MSKARCATGLTYLGQRVLDNERLKEMKGRLPETRECLLSRSTVHTRGKSEIWAELSRRGRHPALGVVHTLAGNPAWHILHDLHFLLQLPLLLCHKPATAAAAADHHAEHSNHSHPYGVLRRLLCRKFSAGGVQYCIAIVLCDQYCVMMLGTYTPESLLAAWTAHPRL